jgi:hypothetical protein
MSTRERIPFVVCLILLVGCTLSLWKRRPHWEVRPFANFKWTACYVEWSGTGCGSPVTRDAALWEAAGGSEIGR